MGSAQTKHVVIVGGGFAGIACAQQLARNSEVHVTLVHHTTISFNRSSIRLLRRNWPPKTLASRWGGFSSSFPTSIPKWRRLALSTRSPAA